MGVLRDRPTLIAALLLATLAFAGAVADSHRHDLLASSAGHEDLPTFAVGHEQPDHTVHVEGATRIEPASCVACLQRQRAAGMFEPVLAGFEPSSSAIVATTVRRTALDACCLKAARAPPRA